MFKSNPPTIYLQLAGHLQSGECWLGFDHHATTLPAYNGLCQIILRRKGSGAISFVGQAEGLAPAKWSDPEK